MTRHLVRGLFAFAAALSSPATAQLSPGGPPTLRGQGKFDLSGMLMAYPELARVPAPAWVRPGLRLTYYQASAITPGEGPIFEEDPTGPLRATDGSGKRYRIKPGGRLDRDRYGGENLHGGSSGQGYAEFTVLGVAPDAIAIAVDIYTITGANKIPMLMSHAAFLGAPGSTMDLWVNPAWLKQRTATLNSTMKILRTSVRVGDKQRPAVVFASASGSMMGMYDEETGVLLQHGGAAAGSTGVNLRVDNQYIPNEPSKLFTIGFLRDERVLKLPWSGRRAPSWVATTRAISYSGQTGVLVTGSPNMPLPCSLTLKLLARGEGWARYQAVQSAGGVGGAMPIVSQSQWMAGSDQIGGLWVPPDALGGLQSGQELDRNPVTGIATTVGRRAKGPRGEEIVVITRAGANQQIDYGYDRSTGILVYFSHQVRGLAGSMYTRFTLRQAD